MRVLRHRAKKFSERFFTHFSKETDYVSGAFQVNSDHGTTHVANKSLCEILLDKGKARDIQDEFTPGHPDIARLAGKTIFIAEVFSLGRADFTILAPAIADKIFTLPIARALSPPNEGGGMMRMAGQAVGLCDHELRFVVDRDNIFSIQLLIDGRHEPMPCIGVVEIF